VFLAEKLLAAKLLHVHASLQMPQYQLHWQTELLHWNNGLRLLSGNLQHSVTTWLRLLKAVDTACSKVIRIDFQQFMSCSVGLGMHLNRYLEIVLQKNTQYTTLVLPPSE